MHEGIDGNPQGNQMPSVVTLRYADRRYEDIDSYTVRITADLKHSADELFQETGKHPRVIAWPYGAYNQVARQAAEKLGMTVSLSLGDNLPTLDPGKTLPRLLLGGNIGPNRLAWQLRHQARRDPVRAVQVDLDYVYDADPAQEERNLSHLLDRIKRLQPSEVWLQAYADPKGDGTADAVYFPNRHLPMRADLFSRVAWQLRTRAGVRVYAWMPVLAFNFATQPDLPSLGGPAKPGGDHFRLAPYDAHVRSLIGDMYEDLAMHADEAGVLFSDDAYLRDTDMLGPWAALSPAARTQKLIDFTKELAQRMRVWRPTLRTARNIYTRPITDGAAEAWFAQSLPAFLAAYDTTAIMAMPQLDKQPDSDAWYAALVAKVAATPGGLDGSLFELATRDWNTGKHVPDADLASRFRQLQAAGVRHLGYYPDDFVTDHPDIEAIRPAISTADYPYPAR
jgi:biofilm PGA synthesis lipoprotein PgaB